MAERESEERADAISYLVTIQICRRGRILVEKKRFGWSKVSSNPRTKANFIFSDESSRRVDDDGSTEKFSGEMLAFGSIYEHRQLLVDHRRVSGSSKGLIVSASSLLVRAPVHQIPEYLGRKKKKRGEEKRKRR